MKYTIEGFSQEAAVDMGLCSEDLVLLRWFVDFWCSGKMSKQIHDDTTYAWVNYKTVLEDMPIIRCNKKNLAAKFKRLVEAGVLVNRTIRQNGTFSVYKFGENYDRLIYRDPLTQNGEGLPENEQPGYPKTGNPVTRKQVTKYPSTIKPIYNKTNIDRGEDKHEHTKIAFGEMANVYLTAEEYAGLLVKMGDIGRQKYIDAVSLYKASKGKEYKSDYSACLQFWIKDGRPVENTAVIVPIHIEKPDLSTPEKIREAIFT